jgi:hypothetical protein
MITSNLVGYHTIIPFDWFAFIWCSFVVEVAGKGILGALASFLVLRIIFSAYLEVTAYRYALFLPLLYSLGSMKAISKVAQSTVDSIVLHQNYFLLIRLYCTIYLTSPKASDE